MAKQDVIQHFRTLTQGRAPTAGELEQGEWFINVADGTAYLKDADDNIKEFRSIQVATFNINTNGTHAFSILASAKEIISFVLNQLDYTEFVEINPAGSGNVVYDEVAAEYETEVGDFVKIVYF